MAKEQRIIGRPPTRRNSAGSNPLVYYCPELVQLAVQLSGLSEKEIAAKSGHRFSWQWLYGLEDGTYPRARRNNLIALADTLGIPLKNLTHH